MRQWHDCESASCNATPQGESDKVQPSRGWPRRTSRTLPGSHACLRPAFQKRVAGIHLLFQERDDATELAAARYRGLQRRAALLVLGVQIRTALDEEADDRLRTPA